MASTRMVLSALALTACAGGPSPGEVADTPSEPVAWDERGPHGAGSRSLDITGSTGTPLKLQLWYPTRTEEADVFYDSLIAGRAALNAEVDCDAVRGLVAFSHGYGGTRVQSPFLTEHLASHGFVVVAPDHTGNTIVDAETIPFDEVMLRRPIDVADSADATFAELGDCLDEADGYVVAGHSFGGYTALAAAGATVNDPAGGTVDLSDPRVTAAVGLAPWDAAGGITTGSADIAVPTLILTGEQDATTPIGQVRGLYDPLTVEPRWLGVFPDGGHYTFSPVACVLYTGDGCGEGFVPPEVADPLTKASVTALVAGAFDAVAVEAPELQWEQAR